METGYESDSDFYGQIEIVDRLLERVRKDAGTSRGHLQDQPTVPAASQPLIKKEPEDTKNLSVEQTLEQTLEGTSEHSSQPGQQPRLSNPFSGVPYAWQLGEKVQDFVTRLPPATTVMGVETPWIYVCNPHIDRKSRALAGNQAILGCEDEGTEAEGAQAELFVEGGKERLELLGNFLTGLAGIARIRMPRRAAAAEMEAARLSAVRDILGLASHLRVTCGKWMLFVPPQTVDAVWNIIAHATVRDELGIAAKVAPRDPSLSAARQQTRERLICIYSADFRDRQDVGRILLRLEELGLVSRNGSKIYYKCGRFKTTTDGPGQAEPDKASRPDDAYTYLGIGAQNPWGLTAPLFNSADIFRCMQPDAVDVRD